VLIEGFVQGGLIIALLLWEKCVWFVLVCQTMQSEKNVKSNK
jgi:hypothetical protein